MALSALVALVVVCVCSAQQGTPTRSQASCSSLGWQLGTPDVCASSLITKGSKNTNGPKCSMKVTWQKATTLCAQAQARLCTIGELNQDAAARSGCQLDFERVWTSTTAGCEDRHASTGAGGSEFADVVPNRCNGKEERFYVTCCADVAPSGSSIAQCENDECSTRAHSDNVCVDNGDNTHTCECNGNGWTPIREQTACLGPSNPCEVDDPCSSNRQPGNVCVANRDASHTCSCGEPGWQQGPDDRSCSTCSDPCESDPCSSLLHFNNKCQRVKPRGETCFTTHRCTCATGFFAGNNRKKCTPCLDPCASSPCGDDARNLCVAGVAVDDESGCNGYQCNCLGSNYVTAVDGLSCSFITFCPNPCLNDPCSSLGNGDPANLCIPKMGRIGEDGRAICPPPSNAYTCQCQGQDFYTPQDFKSCQVCSRPCTGGDDPCHSAEDGRNVCSLHETSLDVTTGCKTTRVECTCLGTTWARSEKGDACQKCPAPCGDDWCTSEDGGKSTGNMCMPSVQNDANSCPSYFCVCSLLNGFVAADDLQGCLRCPDPCENDPCGTDPGNLCVPFGGPLGDQPPSQEFPCGGYTCQCAEQTFALSLDLQSCVECEDPCSVDKDPCFHELSTLNVCIRINPQTPYACSTHVCQCGGQGWITPYGAAHCEPCRDPCTGRDPCGTNFNKDNTCERTADVPVIPAGELERRGLLNGAGVARRQFIGLPNDRAATLTSPTNTATGVAQCPGYTCRCRGAGWLTPLGSQTCQPCPNPCVLGDPCGHNLDPRNLCVPNDTPRAVGGQECGGYTCKCAEGWYEHEDKGSCQACPNPCDLVEDPCNQELDSRNYCTPTIYIPGLTADQRTGGTGTGRRLLQAGGAADVCGSYTCTCDGYGWLTVATRRACTPCPDPCSGRGDFCLTTKDDMNRCVPDVVAHGLETTVLAGLPWTGARRLLQNTNIATIAGQEGKCGGYTCKCDGEGWTQPHEGDQTCDACPDPCADDPCHAGMDSKNKCTPTRLLKNEADLLSFPGDKCGGYICECRGEGWLTGYGKLSCEPCPNPCANGDPCSSHYSENNVCVPNHFVPVLPKRDPTAGDDERKLPLYAYSSYVGPTAYEVERTCGGFECKCQGEGWMQELADVACRRCPNPCWPADPCNSKIDPRNECIPDLEALREDLYHDQPWRRTHGSSASMIDSVCGGYICKCGPTDWLQPPDQQSCEPCPNPCTLGDPCSVSQDNRNQCEAEPPLYAVDTRFDDFGITSFVAPNGGSQTLASFSAGANRLPPARSAGQPPPPVFPPSFPSSSSSLSQSAFPSSSAFGASSASSSILFPPSSSFSSSFSSSTFPSSSVSSSSSPVFPSAQSSSFGFAPSSTTTGTFPSSSSTGLPRFSPSSATSPSFAFGGSTNFGSAAGRRLFSHEGLEQIGSGKCGAYVCTCAPGFVTPKDEGACQPCPNPCIGIDPCKNHEDNRNICVPDFAVNAYRRSHEEAITELEPGAFGVCGGYSCQCGGPGFTTPQGAQTCVACPDPCAGHDPCGSREDSRNVCVPAWSNNFAAAATSTAGRRQFGRTTGGFARTDNCGLYRCECAGTGWIIGNGETSCARCPDPCLSEDDPCQVRYGVNNRCIRTNSPLNLGFLANDPLRKCGGYSCQCGAGFITSQNARRCEPCPNPCLGRDPCSQNRHPGNVCVPDLNIGQEGSLRRSHNLDDDDTLVFFQGSRCGGYTCQCAGPLQGWITPPERRSCIPCNNPCRTSDPCSTRLDNRNVCVPGSATNIYGAGGANGDSDGCGGYTCRCSGQGFVAAPGALSCRTCPNPCSFGDPCNTRSDPSNLCEPTNLGNGQAFAANAGSDGCGSYICTCQGAGYVPGPGRRACVAQSAVTVCQDPCLNDPCNARTNRGNRCVNQANVQCGFYECQCASGWRAVQPVVTRGPTCQPFQEGAGGVTLQCPPNDPCLSRLNANNICTPFANGNYQCNCARGWDATGTNGAATAQRCLQP